MKTKNKLYLLKFLILILLSLQEISGYTQNLNNQYFRVSNENLNIYANYLTFINDTVVVFSNIYRPMEKNIRIELKYKKTKDIIEIYSPKNLLDSIDLTKYGFKNNKKLEIVENALLDKENSDIYILRKDFKKNPDLIFVIENEKYRLDMGETDSYGLVTKSPRRNRKLERKLKMFKDNSDFELKILKGYDAYEKYGYDYVFGVFEITRKK